MDGWVTAATASALQEVLVAGDLSGLAQLQITGHLHEPRTIDGNTGLDELLAYALAALHPAQPRS